MPRKATVRQLSTDSTSDLSSAPSDIPEYVGISAATAHEAVVSEEEDEVTITTKSRSNPRKRVAEDKPEEETLPVRSKTKRSRTQQPSSRRKVKVEEEEEEIDVSVDAEQGPVGAVKQDVTQQVEVDAQTTEANGKTTEVDVKHQKRATAKRRTGKKAISNGKAEAEREDPDQADQEVEAIANGVPKKAKRRTKVKATEEVEATEDTNPDGTAVTKVKRRRKTKAEKDAEAMPLAARTPANVSKMFLGAHVSAAGGVHKAVWNANHIGANAFALFLKSQRKWAFSPLEDDVKTQFISSCKEHAYDAGAHTLPHGSYLVNLAHTDKAREEQAYASFIDDLQRCEELGIRLYNFHPGNSASSGREAAIGQIAKQLNKAHTETKTVITVLETMAADGNVIGGTFEDLRDIIDAVKDKKRVGVCIDTCHIFAAGYDLRGPQAFKNTMDKFEDIVGFRYLRALHVNDSKAPLNSRRDLHQNIGLGCLGLRAFHNIMNEYRFRGIPLVLETPIEVKNPETGKDVPDQGIWAREIKLLESLIGMDADTDEFRKMEEELAEKGKAERDRIQEQVDRKTKKLEEKASKTGRKRKKKGDVKAEESSDGKSEGGASSGLSSAEESE